MTTINPISAPQKSVTHPSIVWSFAVLIAGMLLAATLSFVARSEAGPEPMSVQHGRKLAVGTPIHAEVQSGKALAPKPKFAPVQRRGGRPERPEAAAPKRPAGVLVM